MPVEYSGADIFRDALYSWETWGTGIKYFLIFFVAGLVLLGLMALLKALARFIKRILR